ncbi:MAG: exo-alpha-sialidase [Anaerolineae bacterium]|nr:exo-alpha-sialidase [Anaerolineae bacterium]
MPRIKNAREMVIFKELNRYNCQIGATQLANGDVVVIYNKARGLAHLDFDSIALVRSKDNGETWDPLSERMVWQCTPTFGSDTPSVMQLSDGTLLCNFLMTAFVGTKGVFEDFGPQSNVLNAMRECDGVWLTRSNDNGETWTPAYKASVSPLRWGQPIDEPIELPNGTLLMAVQGMMRARAYHSDEEPYRCFLIRSDDKGLNWEHWSTIAFDAAGIISFSEPALGRMGDGTLVAMMRVMHQPHRKHQRMWMAYSRNEGESWSQPEATNLWGFPADLILLQDGRMLCTYGYRREPYSVRGCISNDGIHWDVANEFVIREGGTAPVEAEPNWYWHIGYPTSLQLKDGSMLTVDHRWTSEAPYVQYVVGVRWELGDLHG